MFQSRFADALNRLPLFDDSIGKLFIHLDKITRASKIKG